MADRREERRQYENDVFYDVWRSGGNPDAIDYDRVTENFYDGVDDHYSAQIELNAQRESRRRHEELYREDYEPEEEQF